MNCRMHLKISLFLSALAIVACDNTAEQKETIIAQVGNSRLTKSELNLSLKSNIGSKKYKDEFIKEWIETEILYQLAEEDQLLNYENYDRIISESKKELAAAISINNYLEQHPVIYNDSVLVSFFSQNKDDYSSKTDAYILNLVIFKDEESAIKFRNNAIEENWDDAIKSFSGNTALVEEGMNKVYKFSQIQSKKLLRILNELYKEEISLVVQTELNDFVVVQMIDKINRDSVPQFNYVKDQVQESYIIYNQREMVRNFLDSLITEKKVKVF